MRSHLDALEQDVSHEVFDCAPQPMWIVDLETLRFLDVNPAAIALYGYSRVEFLLMTVPELRLGEDDEALWVSGKDDKYVRKDGTIIDVHVDSSDIVFRGRRARLVTSVDVTSRRDSERALAAQLATTRVLADARSIAEAAPMVLAAMCRNLGWRFGALWAVDDSIKMARCLHVWSDEGSDCESFSEATLRLCFAKGQGLVGRVWATGDAAWVVDVSEESAFERGEAAYECELHSAFAFPVALGTDDIGVLEFFGPRPGLPQESVIRVTASIASQIGQFVDGQRKESVGRRTDAHKSAILDSALDAIVSVDRDLNVAEFNPAAEAMFGYKREEIVGCPAIDVLVAKHVRGDLYNEYVRFRRTGLSAVLNRRVEMMMVRSDGTIFPAELVATAVQLQDGPFFTAYIHDITERKQREGEIRASEAKYRGLMEQASDGILLMNSEGVFVDCNPRLLEMTGYSREEFLKFNIADALSGEQIARLPKFLEDVRSGKPRLFERTLLRKNGEKYPVETSIGLTDDGHMFAIVREITERKRVEDEMRATLEELRQTDAQRRRLLASLVGAQEEERKRISADIHDDSIQVMSALGMRLECMTKSLDDSELRAQMESIRSHVELTVNRLRLLLFDLHPPNLASEGVGSALRAHLENWKSDSITDYSFNDELLIQPDGEVAIILFRVGQEALINIRKHANATRVSISLVHQDGGVLLTVADDGVGFSVDPENLYLPGHLGMQAMRERVEMAGGWVRVQSEPGIGSQLDFWVPDLRDSKDVSPLD